MTGDMHRRHWDAIVIGTGIGGGTIGRQLAEQGMSVLFIEKGRAGHRREGNGLSGDLYTDPIARSLRGAWPDPVHLRLNGRDSTAYIPIGAGVGGSSVFYAGTLERPEPHDLDDSETHPHPLGGWPVSYSTMLPWYDEAEALYSVCGEDDPLASAASPRLRPPLPLGRGDAQMMARMRAAGLHPYQLHCAFRHIENCGFCFGRKCPQVCKMDGRTAGVEPALATGRAVLIDQCEVTELVADQDSVTRIRARKGDETLGFTADRVILAAGALSSPRLLLASRGEHWPDGLGNRNGLVGRNLMFHFNEIFAIWPRRGEAFTESAKSIGFRDLYHVQGQRLGMVQSMGLNVGKNEILQYLRLRLARSHLHHLPGSRQFMHLPAAAAARILGQAKVFVGLLEDLPYRENRVRPNPDRPGHILIEYDFSAELLERRKLFRHLIHKALKGQRNMFLTYDPEPNLGHPCGTLRMGRDSTDSVLDPDCRVHGMRNLWVVDASFMPTSMGVNPSLTIAANALRVAHRMEHHS
ncbi:GMC family oxidoreductase [Pontibaca methylaminivorans]|uniref:GMC family oxidoreductase n=1 Tax=Pontibaca methylaminivorans TaxID=515897 RepID=UPI002FD8E0FF